jgi:peroxiredoxin
MKKAIYALLLPLFFSCYGNKDENFNIKGTLKNAGASLVYLEETTSSGAPVILDSAKLEKDGDFILSTEIKDDRLYNLRLNSQPYPFVSLINDSKDITVEADFNKQQDFYTVKGSDASEQLRTYVQTLNVKLSELGKSSQELVQLSQNKAPDSVLQPRRAEVLKQSTELKSYATNFTLQSKSPSLTLFALGTFQNLASNPMYGIPGWTNEEMTDLLTKAAQKFPNYPTFNEIRKSYTPAAAPEFTLPDVNGTPVSLSSFRGKYVLVDFWASWCRPCRDENPNVVSAYKQFRNKNFTILGVSLDKEKEPWLQAIKKDSLNWTHVSDLKFWQSSVVPMYGIEGIPYNVLLDPKGNIIAERLTGASLHQTLSQVLK